VGNLANITVEVRVWYNVGATSYVNALAQGFNVGDSNPVEVQATERPTAPEGLEGLRDFTVQSVPEPSCASLIAIATATFSILRRRAR
jgi:hypothetical protein